MANDNNITIIGNITRDPELRFTSSGQALLLTSVANNRSWTDRASGERREHTTFTDVKVWGQLAQNVADSVAKGTRVVVTGRIEQESWTDQSGQNRSRLVIVAEDVAPSLRWATAQVTKTPPPGNSGSNGGGYVPADNTAAMSAEEPF